MIDNNTVIQSKDLPATYKQIGLINTAIFNLHKKGKLNGEFKFKPISKFDASRIISELQTRFSFNDLLDE